MQIYEVRISHAARLDMAELRTYHITAAGFMYIT